MSDPSNEPSSPSPHGPGPRRGADPLLRILGLSGVLSAAFLVLATVLGAALRDDYSHVRHSISELYETGAPNAALLMVLFTTYHALVIPFAVGLHRGLPGRGGKARAGPVALGLAGLLGIPLGAWARCDPGCFGATTLRGQLHGVLVLVTVPLIFFAIVAVWHRLRDHPGWRGYATYSLATAVAGILFGVGMTPFMEGPLTGLLERISVGIIVQWYVVMGLRLMAQGRGARRPPRSGEPAGRGRGAAPRPQG